MTDNVSKIGTDTKSVHVNKLPIPCSIATYLDCQPGDPLILFNASCSNDPDGYIVSYEWNFGDGTIGTGATVQHNYLSVGSFYVTLKVIDNDGFEKSGYKTIGFSQYCRGFYYTNVSDCNCKNMTVRTAGNSGMYPGGFSHVLGPNNTVILANPGPYELTYYFEVVTNLKDGSDPKKCTESQSIKRTSRSLNVTSDKNTAGGASPRVGGNPAPNTCPYDPTCTQPYCPDGYDIPYDFKEHDGLQIRWLDAPGWSAFNTLPKSRVQRSDYVWYQAAFKAEVKGSRSVCNCTWKMEYNISQTGLVITAPRVFDVNCKDYDPPAPGGGGGGGVKTPIMMT